ncbi:MAG: gfo/Idh/MocA family oxidoreductase, partial [Nitrospirae bacterium]|nr:gfo/Idh/MocA family oxidoreductase [Fimbriimonadaceae bacterium]
PFMGLDLREPIAVQAETSGNNKETFPTWSRVKYEFGQRGNRDALMLYWYDGGQKPPAEVSKVEPMGGNGTLIVAEKGTIHLGDAYGGAPKMVGGGEVPMVDFEKSPGHFQELVDAINGGKAPRSNIADYSGPLTETVLLGNLAIWAGGERVVWDSRRLAVVGSNAFDPLIRPTYREGYSL